MNMSARVFLVLTLSLGLAASAKVWPQFRSEDARTLRATGDNMTLAFVPLISLIANFLPRFFNRLGTASPTTVQQARYINQEGKENAVCEMPEHEGLMWQDPDNHANYYSCFMNEHCLTTKHEPCFELRNLKCDPPLVFNFKNQQCQPKMKRSNRNDKFK